MNYGFYYHVNENETTQKKETLSPLFFSYAVLKTKKKPVMGIARRNRCRTAVSFHMIFFFLHIRFFIFTCIFNTFLYFCVQEHKRKFDCISMQSGSRFRSHFRPNSERKNITLWLFCVWIPLQACVCVCMSQLFFLSLSFSLICCAPQWMF